jgi:hypothetical protein
MSKFLLDANIFIEAYRRYYSFDIAPAFWSALKQNAEADLLVSIDRIYDEINHYDDDDELKRWANSEFRSWFISTDNEEVFKAYREVIEWVMGQTQFTEPAKAEFASVGDSWLIACAKTHDYIIVTHEGYDANIKRKIPIPNVCRAFGITYIDTFEMLRRLNIRLG